MEERSPGEEGFFFMEKKVEAYRESAGEGFIPCM
jgi:hypothetical protein